MPLPAPILDDRSYQQLRDELVRRIPVYAPEWTDHNASDPGITLIELFAFLGENLLFRFNQIPEATKLAFLKLLHIPLRPAMPARTLVTFARADKLTIGTTLPLASEVKAGNVSFETRDEVVVYPLDVLGVARLTAPAPATPETQAFTKAAIEARGGLKAGEVAAYYTSALVPVDPGAPGTVSVDLHKAVDGALWVAVLATKLADPQKLKDVLKNARQGAHGALLNVGFVPDADVVGIDDVDPCPGTQPTDAGREMIWEASTPRMDHGQPVYLRLSVEGDTTRGLSQEGIVRLRLPHDPDELGLPNLTDLDLVGTGTFPPALDDEETNKRLRFWLRATPRDATRPLGRALFVGINAAEVIQARKANPEFLGIGNGQAHQTFTLVNRPVIQGSTRIQVEEDQGWVDWQAVDGFEASREDAPHYVLDPEAGTIRFGNGVQGKAPQIGQRLRAREYRYGGGVEGNVGAKAIAKVTDHTELSAANPLPARGGAPVESIAEALERIPGEFRRHDRAVTHSDFEELALATPGAGVARADCIPLFHPPTRNLQAAGVVSVVVWPREDRKHPTAPMPDRTLLREVCCWLDARRLITTELYVIPPTYRKVAVAVGLQAKRGYGIEAVRRWVELVIRQYLAPVPPYGPEGRGWPLGRRVYGPELEAAALQVEGVEFLEGLEVAALNPVTQQFVPFVNKPIELNPWEVPELVEITVVQGPPLAPGKQLTPAPSPKIPVPIPTLREEC